MHISKRRSHRVFGLVGGAGVVKKTRAKITISNGQYITIFNDLTKLNNGILKIIKGVKIDDASPEHPEERSTF